MADPATSPEGVDTVDDRRAGRASYQDPLAALTMAGVPISTAARRGAGQRS